MVGKFVNYDVSSVEVMGIIVHVDASIVQLIQFDDSADGTLTQKNVSDLKLASIEFLDQADDEDNEAYEARINALREFVEKWDLFDNLSEIVKSYLT